MANFTYTSDLLADALFRSGEPTDGTSDYAAQALVFMNRAYQAIYAGGSSIDFNVHENWRWLRKSPPGNLVLQPPITDGTVSVTQNSAAITFSVPPGPSVAGYQFRVGGFPDVFTVSAHTAGQASATLDGVYTGATNIVAGYILFKTTYTLASDVLRLVGPMRAYRLTGEGYRRYQIDPADLDQMEDSWPLTLIQAGMPELFAVIGDQKVRFSHFGGPGSADYIRVEYEYVYRPAALTNAALEEPVFPMEHRKVLSDITTAYILGVKHDDRATGALQLAQAGLRGMAGENQRSVSLSSDNMFRIFPRPRRRGIRFPAATPTSLISMANGAVDFALQNSTLVLRYNDNGVIKTLSLGDPAV